MEFVTLGTAGGPVPLKHRAQPAHAVISGERTILVDCGDGAMGQLMRAGIDFRHVNEIIISHHHFDHIGGLYTCLGINMMLQRKSPLKIYGPPGTSEIIRGLLESCNVPRATGFGIPGQTLPHPNEFVEVYDLLPEHTLNFDDLRISFCENTHFRVEEDFGKPGPISFSMRFDTETRSIVYTGDTGPCEKLEQFSHFADLLVAPLMDAEKIMHKVRMKNPHMSEESLNMMAEHMAKHFLTAGQLGDLANVSKVGHVVAVHIPLDYMNQKTAPDYIKQISLKFSGKITLAEDLNRF